MNLFRRVLCIGSVLTVLTSYARYMETIELPSSLKPYAVYYIKTKQLDTFSCGYNVLFNAANFEHWCGFSNAFHRYSIFREKVMPYLQAHGHNPIGPSDNRLLEYLAQTLRLQPLYHLTYESKHPYKVRPLISETISITYPLGISQKEIDQRLDKALKARERQELRSIQNYLAKNAYNVVHFCCSSKDHNHWILVSLHQNETGRGLFIFDNLNDPLYYASDLLRYLEYLIDTFNISSYESFDPPVLPYRWQFLDQPLW